MNNKKETLYTVKEFCKKYNELKSKQAKDALIESIMDVHYVPFLVKNALMDAVVKTTMTDKDTGNIHVNSVAEYLLMNRIFIEQYTKLKVETEGFFEEYDDLVQSGLFDILIIGVNGSYPAIPKDEMTEFRNILSLKKNDLLCNKYEIHSYITEQIDKFKMLGEATLTPLADVIKDKLDGLSEEDMDKILEFAKKDDFKEV